MSDQYRRMPVVTHEEAQMIGYTKAAISAMNTLVMYVTSHPWMLPDGVRERIIEADYLLNSSEDYYIVNWDQLAEAREVA